MQPTQGAAGPGVPGFVDGAGGVGGVGCGGRFVVLDDLQAGVFGALQHPLQGDFGELAFGVAAADVGMGTGEPELFEGLVGFGAGCVPQQGLELGSAFVDSQGVAGVGDLGAEFGVEEAAVAVEVAERADGVPGADEVHRAGAGVAAAEGGGFLRVVLPGVEAGSLGDAVFPPGVEQAALFQDAGEGAHGVGAAGEAEQEYAVALVVVLHEEAVAVFDVGGEAVAEQLAHGGADAVVARQAERGEGADAGFVGDDLVVVGGDTPQQVDDVGVDGALLVAGAVAAEDDVPFHGISSQVMLPCGAL